MLKQGLTFEHTTTKAKNKKIIGVMKDELSGKIIKEVVGLRAKSYSYLIDDGSKDKKAKGTKKCVKKENLNWKIIKTLKKQSNLKTK